MATTAADLAEGAVISNGKVKLQKGGEKKAQEPTTTVKENDQMNSSENFINLPSYATPGPSILHPTVTTWQWLFSASDMYYTPTVLHSGLSLNDEKYSRWKGIQLIFRIGEYLRLGNHVMTTASVFFQRFYMRRALPRDARERVHDTFTFQEMAPACVYLACKVEETQRKLHFVVEATMAVLDRSPQGIEMTESRSFKADVNGREYGRWKDLILLYEERLLEALCFDLIVDQPHPIAIKGCKRLRTCRDMAQLTIVLLNSLLYGAVCTFYDAAVLAAGAFQKACNLVEVDPVSFVDQLDTSYSWYDAFDVDPEEINEAMIDIDEQLAYHTERLNYQRPPIAAPNSQSHSTATSPQYNSQSNLKGDLPLDKQQKNLQFARTENVFEQKVEEDLIITENDGQGIGEESFGQREEQIDSARPISRHGSKGSSLGPPPPLASSEEKKDTFSKSTSADPHESAVTIKVKQEQIFQEATAAESEEEEEKRQEQIKPEDMAVESEEEEGAL